MCFCFPYTSFKKWGKLPFCRFCWYFSSDQFLCLLFWYVCFNIIHIWFCLISFFLLSFHLFSYSFFLPLPLNMNSFLFFFDILVKTEFFLKVLLLDITRGFWCIVSTLFSKYPSISFFINFKSTFKTVLIFKQLGILFSILKFNSTFFVL